MTLRPLLLGTCLAILSGCGEEPLVASGVVHLDLRLEDGRSPARVLYEAAESLATPVTATVDDSDGEAAIVTWTPSHAFEVEVLPAGDGWVFRGGKRAPGGREVFTLSAHDIDADRWDALRLEAMFEGPALVRFAWVAGGELHSHEAEVRLSLELRPQRVELATLEAWTGAVEQAWLEFRVLAGTPVRVRELAFAAGGLQLGLEPPTFEAGDSVSRGAKEAPERGDVGLVPLGFDARRAWPADLGMPLVATVDVPVGGALSLALAAGPSLTGARATLHTTLDLRRLSGQGADVERVAERDLEPPRTEADAAWSPWTVDLSAYAGERVELRLTTTGTGPTREGRPPLCRVLYATPEVVGELPSARRPNLLLVTMDTTRSDAVGGRGWTPNLDALAARGALYTSAWSAAESTTASHASILSGRMVQEHGALGNRYELPAENQMLAEALRDAGYHTMAAVSVAHLEAGNGFGQGFDQFKLSQPGSNVEGRYAVEGLEDLVAEWEGESKRPLFLWLHVFDPHTPYGPPEEFVEAYLAERGIVREPRRVERATLPWFDPRAAGYSWLEGANSLARVRQDYHLGVAYADHLVGRLLATLEAAGELEHTAVCVTSDHGDAMGEQGLWFNHVGLYPSVLHVPLVLALPESARGPRGLRVDEPVSAIDLAPTLLRLAGVAPLPGMHGRSLLDAAARAEAVDPGPGDEALVRRVWFQHSGIRMAGYRDAGGHFVDTFDEGVRFLRGEPWPAAGSTTEAPAWTSVPIGQRFLFELGGGPGNTPELGRDMAPERPDEVEARAAELARWMDVLGSGSARRAELTAEDEAVLRDLGYAGD